MPSETQERLKLKKLKYRPDIDGLRGISVLLVLLFHTGGLVPGGFIGVDVFFVISGFLITSIVQYEIDQEKFLLRNFWARRIRRILPASVVCILGTLFLSGIVMLPNDFVNTAKSAVASSVALANVFFWQDGGYFAGPSETKPLLHFWSLAVEEQFYLFYPFLLFALSKLNRKLVAKCICGLCLVSFAISVLGVYYRPSATFYLLPTRAWEMFLGGILALIPITILKGKSAELFSAFGILLILVPAFTYDSVTPFPGLAAALPCLGASLLIWSHSGPHPSLSKRILEYKPLVFIGVISYSLYLWHWPVLALMKYSLIEITLLTGTIATLISFMLAYLSWRFVEQIFRSRRSKEQAPVKKSSPWRTIVWGLSATACLLLLSSSVVLGNGFSWRFRSEVQPYLDDAVWRGDQLQTFDTNFDFPRLGDVSLPKDQFVIWGDSHALVMSDVISKAAKEIGVAGRLIAAVASPPLPAVTRCGGTRASQARTKKIIEHLLDQQIPNVVLVARWSAYSEGFGKGDLEFEARGMDWKHFIIGDEQTIQYTKEDSRRVLRSQLSKLVKQLHDAGIQVWIVQQVPEQNGPTALPYLLEKHIGLSAKFHPATWEENQERQSTVNSILFSMKKWGAFVLETQSLCFDDDASPILFHNGRACYSDNDHLSRYGASALLGDTFRNMMQQISDQKESVSQN